MIDSYGIIKGKRIVKIIVKFPLLKLFVSIIGEKVYKIAESALITDVAYNVSRHRVNGIVKSRSFIVGERSVLRYSGKLLFNDLLASFGRNIAELLKESRSAGKLLEFSDLLLKCAA